MNPLNLPAAYLPFGKLRIGDNLVDNAQALVTIGGHAPLLLGNGKVPHVWLSAPGEQPGAPWRPLIVDNVPSLPDLTVEAFQRLVKVHRAQATLLTATRGDDDVLVVQLLDLRPLGLDIFSDAQGLHVMGNTMTRNVFRSVPVVMACGAAQ